MATKARSLEAHTGPEIRFHGISLSLKNTSHTRKQYIDATISFLGLLAGYLELHLRRAWAPLLFDDEALEQDRKTRDPSVSLHSSSPARKSSTIDCAWKPTGDGTAHERGVLP